MTLPAHRSTLRSWPNAATPASLLAFATRSRSVRHRPRGQDVAAAQCEARPHPWSAVARLRLAAGDVLDKPAGLAGGRSTGRCSPQSPVLVEVRVTSVGRGEHVYLSVGGLAGFVHTCG
jgi:hypothetical protein